MRYSGHSAIADIYTQQQCLKMVPVDALGRRHLSVIAGVETVEAAVEAEVVADAEVIAGVATTEAEEAEAEMIAETEVVAEAEVKA